MLNDRKCLEPKGENGPLSKSITEARGNHGRSVESCGTTRNVSLKEGF